MVAIATTLVLVFFLILGLIRNRPDLSHEEFFLMSRQANAADYLMSTVAYSLQVAVTIYFVFWGFKYGWSNLFFLISWGLGIGLYALTSQHLFNSTQSKKTYFSILFENKKYRIFGIILAAASLIGLVYTEFYYVSDFLASAILSESPFTSYSNIYWIVLTGLTFTVIFYSLLGGMRKVVFTDKWQLGIGLLTIQLVFASLADAVARNGITTYLWLYIPLLALLTATLYLNRPNIFIRIKETGDPSQANAIPFLLGIFGLMTMLVSFFSNISVAFHSNAIGNFPKGPLTIFHDAGGMWPIVGFGIANLIWQFGDYTAFHRVSLLPAPSDTSKGSAQLRSSILRTAFASPLTWGLGIFLGMTLDASGLFKTSGFSIYTDFTRYCIQAASDGSLVHNLTAISLTLFLVTVLLSTVDSGFISLGQMLLSESMFNSRGHTARIALLVGMGGAVLTLGLIHAILGLNILIALNAFYAWGLVCAPPFAAKLLGIRLNDNITVLALLLGATAASWATVYDLRLNSMLALVFPSLLGISISLGVVLLPIATRFVRLPQKREGYQNE